MIRPLSFYEDPAYPGYKPPQQTGPVVGASPGTNAGGIPGFLGATKGYDIYTAPVQTDPNYAGDRNAVGSLYSSIADMPTRSADVVQADPAAQSAGTNVDTAQQDQFRVRQMALADTLNNQANGIGPSVAGSQLQQSSEMNLQAAMAQAASARGGSLGAAQYQLGNARASIAQQAAMQLAQARIQEQMTARSQLGDVLNSGRGADIGLAASQAGLTQANNQFNAGAITSNNQFNAGLLQDRNKTNLGSIVNQDQYKMDMRAKLLAMGYTMDQANVMLGVSQAQFDTGELNKGQAAAAGVSSANSAQGTQVLGATIGAIGNILKPAAAAA